MTLFHRPCRGELGKTGRGVRRDAAILATYLSSAQVLRASFVSIEVATPSAPPLLDRGYHVLTWRSHGHSLAAYL